MKSKLYNLKIELIKNLLFLIGPNLSARLLVKIGTNKSRINGKFAKTILTIDKTHFSKDIDQLALNCNFNIIRINNGFLCLFQQAFLDVDILKQTDYQFIKDEYIENWQFLEKFNRLILNLLEMKYSLKINAILVSHIDYGHVEGMRLVACRQNIKFASLVRENFILPREQDDVKNYYLNKKFKFEGDRIFVFSQATKNILASAEVFPDKKIIVTGSPRFDYWRDIKIQFDHKSLVTLASFSHADYLAPNAFYQTLTQFIFIAKKFKNINFFIKAKDRADYYRITNHIEFANLPNLEVSFECDNKSLLTKTRVLIAFNSLMITEGLMAKSHILIPYFDDARRDDKYLMHTPNNDVDKSVFSFVENKNNFLPLIEKFMNEKFDYDNEQVRNCISRILYLDASRSASQILHENINELITDV